MSHKEAQEQESHDFSTHPALSNPQFAHATGTKALLKNVSEMYSSAIKAAQAPLSELLFAKRSELVHMLDNLPPQQAAHIRFSEIWLSLHKLIQANVDQSAFMQTTQNLPLKKIQ